MMITELYGLLTGEPAQRDPAQARELRIFLFMAREVFDKGSKLACILYFWLLRITAPARRSLNNRRCLKNDKYEITLTE